MVLMTVSIFPIYPDEIATRFWLSRLPYDFPYKITVLPTCSDGHSQVFPLSWIWPGAINWLVHGSIENLYALRIVGVVIPCIWLWGLFFYLYGRLDRIVKNRDENGGFYRGVYCIGFIISLVSIGVYPVALVENRHEQLIIPAIILIILIFLYVENQRDKIRLSGYFGVLAAYLTSVSLIIYAHPKGIFLAPFILFVGLRLFTSIENWLIRLLAGSWVLFSFIQGYLAWKYSFLCEAAPSLDHLLKSFSFDPLSLFYSPQTFLDNSLGSLANFKKYLHQIGFQASTDLNYLPPHKVGLVAQLANLLISTNFIAVFFGLSFCLPYLYWRNDIKRKRFQTINGVLLSLLFCLFISAVFNLPKNWYDAGYVYTVLIIILVFFIAENFPDKFFKPAVRKAMVYLFMVSILSQVVFLHRNLIDFFKGYAGPGVPLINYHSNESTKEIEAASEVCNINPVSGKSIIVDDYTYLFFSRSRNPIPITYVLVGNNAAGIQSFISRSNSSGMALRCDALPQTYKPYAIRVGRVCCIPEKSIKMLPLPN